MLQTPDTDTDTTVGMVDPLASRFSRIFCTESEGPVNAHVLEEERLKKLAAEMVRHSPELALILASAGR
jgi:hypothetical protein